MVKQVFSFINKEFSGLHEAAFLLGISAFLSQILALLRDRLLASTFGPGSLLDVYYASFKIPDILFASVASFVSVTVIIPFIVEYLSEGKKSEAREFLDSVFTIFCLVMVVVSGVSFVLMPYLMKYVAPGFTPEMQKLLVTLSRILLFSPFLLGLSNLIGSATQALRKFFVFALTPVVYNIGIIVGVVVFYPIWGIHGLVYGVVLGAFLHMVIQIPILLNAGLLPTFTLQLDWSRLRRVIMVSLPRTIAMATDKVSLLILVALGSLMAAGSITIFNFALNLQSVPLAVVGVSYSVAAFPALAEIHRRGNLAEFAEKVSTAIRHIIFWSLPATVLFIVLRAQIVRVLLGAGEFSWSDTRLTAAALALFAVSILAQSLILLFVRAYYAGGQTLKPLVINISCSILTVILALGFMRWFEVSKYFRLFFKVLLRVDNVHTGTVLMLPLGYSLGDILNAAIFWWYFGSDFHPLSKQVYQSFWQCLVSALTAGGATYILLEMLGRIFDLNHFSGIFSQGLLAGLGGIACFVFLLTMLDNKELKDIQKTVTHKLWKNKTVVAEQNI